MENQIIEESESPSEPQSWPVLNAVERRVLGVLIEKAKTTPDAYPLTLNSLITGSNQKSNRDPVMFLDDTAIEAVMPNLKGQGYVQQIMGSGRVDKYRHNLYEAWRVNKVELAILGELLLRGAQSLGDLRGRASRMEPIPDLDQLRTHLKGLVSRGLVVYLTPEERRGAMVTHGFGSPKEIEESAAAVAHLTSDAAPAPLGHRESGPRGMAALPPDLMQRIESLENRLAEAEKKLDQLSATVLGG